MFTWVLNTLMTFSSLLTLKIMQGSEIQAELDWKPPTTLSLLASLDFCKNRG